MKYRQLNNVFGWITAAIAFIVYLLTMERTVSFWDCGEFLACAYKMEVGHSPGAPFFMLMQRIASMFSGPAAFTGQPSAHAVLFINGLSVLMSALTILFLFWTITYFAKRLLAKDRDVLTTQEIVLILAAGMTGGLAYTFSDTFWFSAVEAEVYATSSCFTALVFWAMLKWERNADRPYADRWLLLIAYLVGISAGVHLLQLLAIPALAMIYYFRRYEASRKGVILGLFAGCLLLGIVQVGVLQLIPVMASKMELLFVNNLGLPYDLGAITFVLLLVALLIWLLLKAKSKGWYLAHTGLLCILFIVIGFSSYLLPITRSRAHVPVNMTNPDNVLSLASYIQRDQYLQQPLLHGPDYNSEVTGLKNSGEKYSRVEKDGRAYYEPTDKKVDYEYNPADLRFFPRIWDNTDPAHGKFYQSYLGLGEGEKASSSDNLRYFLGYQVNWLWWRYFMWNYAGRQNDVQGQGEAKNGNWISGIKALDQARVGDIDKMPPGYAKNKARNQLYFLPLILGLMGMVYQFNRNRKDGIIVFLLFLFTGFAIAVYLNMYPMQPRERDYAFAGSTYAFAVWIGLGVLVVHQIINWIVKGSLAVTLAAALCLLAVPALMAKEEWDDHDRSGKSLAWASAYNTLQSCAPNAILFSTGDNDTYPLWYLQEVEGVRPDVRVVITELAGADWFVDQLNYKVNKADAVPMVWKRDDYLGGRRNYVPYYENPSIPKDRYFDLYEICRFVASDNPANKIRSGSGEYINYLPSKNFFVASLSKEELVKKGLLKAGDTARVTNELKFTFPKNNAFKNDLAVMNIIAAVARQGWDRPIYFNGSFPGNANMMGLGRYLRQEGIVYRLLPYHYNELPPPGQIGSVDAAKSFDLYLSKYHWGGAGNKNVYFDEKNRVMLIAYRMYASGIADQLTAEGKKEDAVRLLDVVTKNISEVNYPLDFTSYYMVLSYYQAGAPQKAKALAGRLMRNMSADLQWIAGLGEDQQSAQTGDIRTDLSILNQLANAADKAGDKDLATASRQVFESYYNKFSPMLEQKQG